MTAPLEITEDERGEYGLRWVCDDGDLGGLLGETVPRKKPTKGALREIWVAFQAARPLADRYARNDGLYFETYTKAQAARRAAAAALKADRLDRPWPEWASTALAAGWKPPKGWAP